nr:hypothetical protein [Micromonospora sp. DSM 115978]
MTGRPRAALGNVVRLTTAGPSTVARLACGFVAALGSADAAGGAGDPTAGADAECPLSPTRRVPTTAPAATAGAASSSIRRLGRTARASHRTSTPP